MGKAEDTGTLVRFKPDPLIFETVDFSFETLAFRLREFAFLSAGIKIELHDERDGRQASFHYEGGISSFVQF